MAALTVTKTTYGFRCTGGVTETSISTDKQWVYKFSYIPATNSNAVTIKDKNSNSIDKIIGATAATSYERTFRNIGACFDGLLVTLQGASDELHIFTV